MVVGLTVCAGTLVVGADGCVNSVDTGKGYIHTIESLNMTGVVLVRLHGLWMVLVILYPRTLLAEFVTKKVGTVLIP